MATVEPEFRAGLAGRLIGDGLVSEFRNGAVVFVVGPLELDPEVANAELLGRTVGGLAGVAAMAEPLTDRAVVPEFREGLAGRLVGEGLVWVFRDEPSVFVEAPLEVAPEDRIAPDALDGL